MGMKLINYKCFKTVFLRKYLDMHTMKCELFSITLVHSEEIPRLQDFQTHKNVEPIILTSLSDLRGGKT
jgi:hypothetical protein